MQKVYEDQYHKLESDHWWFKGRRDIVQSLVVGESPKPEQNILEIGCSGGPLMSQLRQEGFQNITGIDCSDDAIRRCHEAGLKAEVMDARTLTFGNGSLDMVIASDILEHLSDDSGALLEWNRVLKPGGLLIVFVPAFMFLWTEHDSVNKHFRRYRRGQLFDLLKRSGFKIERTSYWNTFLFPPIAVVRGIKRLFTGRRSNPETSTGDLFVPPRLLNAALLAILRIENAFFRRGANWPFGVSVMAVARKAQS